MTAIPNTAPANPAAPAPVSTPAPAPLNPMAPAAPGTDQFVQVDKNRLNKWGGDYHKALSEAEQYQEVMSAFPPGTTPAQIKEWLSAPAEPPAPAVPEPPAPEDENRPLTVKEWKAEQARMKQEALNVETSKGWDAENSRRKSDVARTLKELGYEDKSKFNAYAEPVLNAIINRLMVEGKKPTNQPAPQDILDKAAQMLPAEIRDLENEMAARAATRKPELPPTTLGGGSGGGAARPTPEQLEAWKKSGQMDKYFAAMRQMRTGK